MADFKNWSSKSLLLVIAITVFGISAKAQDLTISGTVRDKETSEALGFVTIYISGTNIGTQSDDNGFYKLIIPQKHQP